jgi:hypothetical protein
MTGHTIETWDSSERISVKLGLLLPVLLARRLRAFILRGQTEQQDMLAVRFTRNPRAARRAGDGMTGGSSVGLRR